MNTLDTNIFTDVICPLLTGKIIDDILLVSKDFNKVIKADMNHLYSLFWKIEEGRRISGFKYKERYKDEKLEGEQLEWYRTGPLFSKSFYNEGKMEGEQLTWYKDGQLFSKHFYKEGKQEGEQLRWYRNGQLWSKQFYNDGKEEGEQLEWWNNGQLMFKDFYKNGKKEG